MGKKGVAMHTAYFFVASISSAFSTHMANTGRFVLRVQNQRYGRRK